MTDLHARFRTLDQTPVPDLWMTIERRAAEATPVRAAVGRPTAVGRRGEDAADAGVGHPLAVLIVIALLVALAVGALAAGSGLLRAPAIVPVPAPLATATRTATPSPSAAVLVPTWDATGDMSIGRYLETATVLSDGGVLVAGGRSDRDQGVSLASAEVYDATTRSWTTARDMDGRRSAHTATLLPDGRVLVAGGYDDWAALDTAELYDPATGSWTTTGRMIEARGYHTATLLRDGRVLVAGGRSNNSSTGHALASAELYDPATGSWSATEAMLAAHTFDAATLLEDGRVLVTGAGYRGYELASEGNAEVYDPRAGSWSATGPMIAAGAYQTATRLDDGRVLVAGGSTVEQSFCCAETGVTPAPTQLYDPSSGLWTATGTMTQARTFHTATLLPDGTVLVTGGDRVKVGVGGGGTSTFSTEPGLVSAESYDPESGEWTPAPDLAGLRALHAAVLLKDGQVLIAGGSSAGQGLRTVELFGTR